MNDLTEINASASVIKTVNNDICYLNINRPDKLNALSEEVLSLLISYLSEISESTEIKVIILRSSGKAFCAGHDLRQMMDNHNQNYFDKLFSLCSEFMVKLTQVPQVVITRVHGLATAAGCQLVAQSDIAVCSDDALFATSGVNLGLFCSTPSVAVSRNVPRKIAAEMLFTGDFIDANYAKKIGLVNHIVSKQNLDEKINEVANKITSKPFKTISLGKEVFYKQYLDNLQSAYDVAAKKMACNMMYEETIEKINNFLNKKSS
jgi:enoyl-CoA hydratase/carnithine racemase